jgi:two-component system nitrogen regulation sensor histidine kinase GlnL
MRIRKSGESLPSLPAQGAEGTSKSRRRSTRSISAGSSESSCFFEVDKDLRIVSLGRDLEEVCGRDRSEVEGRLYHEVFPRITCEDGDAVERVLIDGTSKTVRGCTSACFYGSVSSDVEVRPLRDRKGKSRGASVTFCSSPACALYRELQKSRPLIDIGKIASSLAHGVRNPLNAIKGAVVYLNEKYASEKPLVEFTRIIQEEISRLDGFIARFLSSSIIEEGLSETNINAVVRKAEILVSFQARSHNIKTLFGYGTAAPVTANAFHLEQAVFNVINNAIEAMGSGGYLTVRTGTETRDGLRYAVIAVSDTGSGMPETNGKELTSVSTARGKGFGLFLTREFLRYYGGHLEIESKKGVSTTVRLYLPVHGAGKRHDSPDPR